MIAALTAAASQLAAAGASATTPETSSGWVAATMPSTTRGGALPTALAGALPSISSGNAPAITAAPTTDAVGPGGSVTEEPTMTVEPSVDGALPTASGVLAPDAFTGVPEGAVLTPRSGNITITTAGFVLQNVDLQGCLLIRAADVVIRNSRITCGRPPGLAAVQTGTGALRVLLEDSEIDGMGTAQIGLGYSNITARRVEIRNTNDGLRAGSDVVVENSWIHDMARQGDLHPDAIQSTGGTNITIRGNHLDPYTNATGDLVNAAIMLGSELTSTGLNNVLVENNYLNGGNYTVNMRGDTVFSNVIFRNNVFGSRSRYGPFQAPVTLIVDATNILSSTGTTFRVNPAR